MPTLDTFRLLGKHLIGALAGIYIAAALARFLAWVWPSARLPTFIIASLFFVFAEVSVTIRELHKGKLATGIIVLDSLPFVLLGTGLSLFLGKLASQRFGSDIGGVVVFVGIYFCILVALAGVKGTVQDRDLKEDLVKAPPYLRSTDSATVGVSQPGLDETEQEPPQKRSTLQAIAKAVLVLVVIALMFLLLSLIHG